MLTFDVDTDTFSYPQDKLLDVGLKGAWLLLWLRAPLPPPSHLCTPGWEEPGTPSIDAEARGFHTQLDEGPETL